MKKLLVIVGAAFLIAGCHSDRNSGGMGNQSDTNYNFNSSTATNQNSGGVGDELGKSSGSKDNGNSKDYPNPNQDDQK